MATAVKLSDSIVSQAKIMSKAINRIVAGQIEHRTKMKRIAKKNPDLPHKFIKNILMARQEVQSGKLEPFSLSAKRKT